MRPSTIFLSIFLLAVCIAILIALEETGNISLLPLAAAAGVGVNRNLKKGHDSGKRYLPVPVNNAACPSSFESLVREQISSGQADPSQLLSVLSEKLKSNGKAVEFYKTISLAVQDNINDYRNTLSSSSLSPKQKITLGDNLNMMQIGKIAVDLYKAIKKSQIEIQLQCIAFADLAAGWFIHEALIRKKPLLFSTVMCTQKNGGHQFVIAGIGQHPLPFKKNETLEAYLARLAVDKAKYMVMDAWFCPKAFLGNPEQYSSAIRGQSSYDSFLHYQMSGRADFSLSLPDFSRIPATKRKKLEVLWQEIQAGLKDMCRDYFPGLSLEDFFKAIKTEL